MVDFGVLYWFDLGFQMANFTFQLFFIFLNLFNVQQKSIFKTAINLFDFGFGHEIFELSFHIFYKLVS